MAKQKICGCGWIKNLPLTNVERLCCYKLGDKRCQLPGTVSLGMTSDKFWCSAHFVSRHDPQLSATLFYEIENNVDIWLNRQSWRVKLLKEKMHAQPKFYSCSNKDIQLQLDDIKHLILND